MRTMCAYCTHVVAPVGSGWWGDARTWTLLPRRDGTNLIVLHVLPPRVSRNNAIAVDAAERSLNYGRLCGVRWP